MTKLNFTVLICSIFSISICFGQNVPTIKSPQTYDMEKFGNIPISTNTGSVSYDINLFSYDNIYNGNGLSVDLKYYGTGFIPSKKSNYVGLDWSLYAGGSISREVRGLPDDYFPEIPRTVNNSVPLYGYLEGLRNCHKNNIDTYNQNYSGLTGGYGSIGMKCGTYAYEIEPDKFNFNFMGISGYFFIGNDKTPVIVSDDANLIIDISQMSSRQPLNSIISNGSMCLTKPTIITITDGKGIKYYFGGNYENLEVSYPLYPEQTTQNRFTITAWNLFKIEYPNTNVIDITYVTAAIDITDRNFCMDRDNISINTEEPFLLMFDHHHIQKQEIKVQNSNYNTSSGNLLYDGTIHWGNESTYSNTIVQSFSATKKSFPSQISLNGNTLVTFNYERFDKYLTHTIPSLKLTGINFFNDFQVQVKNVTLDYHRHKDYFFLNKVKMFRKTKFSLDFIQEHHFDYYSKDNLPDETTIAIDHWGYWNNRIAGKLIPNFTLDKNTDAYSFTENIRDTNPDVYATGLLKTITYPTKGKSEFIYESHKYSEKVDRNYNSQFKNILIPSEGLVGGGRIKEIINYSNDGTQLGRKEYKYISNYSPNGTSIKSSGILSNYYRNLMYSRTQTPSTAWENLDVYSDNFIETAFNSFPVLYSEVTEIDNGKGYTKHYFTDYRNYPDSSVFKEVDNNLNSYNATYFPSNIGNINLPYRSNGYKRGKLYKQEYYDQNFVKLKFSETEFTDIAEIKPNNYATYVTDRLRSLYFFKLYGGLFTPKKTETNDLFNGVNLKTTSEFFYEGNNHFNLTKKKIVFPSSTDVYETKYQYVNDLRYANQPQQHIPPYQSLPYMAGNVNMTENPLVVSNYRNNVFLGRKQTIYERNPVTALILPKTELSYNEDQTITMAGVVLPSVGDGFAEINYDKYDAKGNLLQYTTSNGVPVSIIWGYNGSQPIAKIEGALYDNISGNNLVTLAINKSIEDGQFIAPGYEQALLDALDNLRKDANFSNFQISTYTYNPMVGVTSITPPSGIREVYIYDIANRLKEIREDNAGGKILKEFKYNYKQ